MRFLHLTLLYFVLNAFSSDQALEYSPSAPTKISSFAANPTAANDVEPEATNIIFQSKDGGQAWQDITHTLPENQQPEDFFAGESDLYLRVKNVMYRSKSNLKTPVWVKENILDLRSVSIAFNNSGVIAYNHEGQVYRKMSSTGTWLPIYTNFKKHSMRTIFETSDGTVFIGCDGGLYKSSDRGQSWKQVQNEGMDIVESEGVLIGTGQKGIMRSTDKGEHWESVISEGGVGIAVERIGGGFAAISFNTTTQSRRIRISLDSGKTWKAIDEGLQPSLYILPMQGFQASPSISSIKQMGEYLICGHPNGIFRSSDMGKTWKIVHAGVGEKVFKVYVSGNTLYAVLRNLGC
jgi:photosystem II stability/assembly factor-like uncharacterized protein